VFAPLAGLTNLYWNLDVSANQISDISPLTTPAYSYVAHHIADSLMRLPSLVGLSNITSLDFPGPNPTYQCAGVPA